MSKPFYVTLKNRGFIHLEGEDRIEFLNSLITQDVSKLSEQHIQYGCLLTPQGKFLHDFFLYQGDGFILMECEGGARALDLRDRLLRYRMRSKVQISVEEKASIYLLFNGNQGLIDPRRPDLWRRVMERPDGDEKPFDVYDLIRIENGIPDGSRDMEVEKSTLLECGLDQLNAIDFNKGCYIGQELTARMHYRHLGKKRLCALAFDETPPAAFSDLIWRDKRIGSMRSSSGHIGLAVIQNDAREEIRHDVSGGIRLLGL